MRVCVCCEYKGRLYQVAWFHDSPSGVFAGLYGAKGTHFSYHASGAIHFKRKTGELLHPETSKAPLGEIEAFVNLGSHSIPFVSSKTVAKYTHPFKPAPKDEIVCVLGPGQIRGRVALGINFFIVNRNHEQSLVLSFPRALRAIKEVRLLQTMTFALDHFPNQKVVMMLIKSKISS